MTYTTVHHQGAINTSWLQIWGALMLSIFPAKPKLLKKTNRALFS